ncbi:MAG: hypothetical protein H6773_00040 [Pseudomonadales bacterium]|nr:hypothetical protein [Pseudomonadales bacterium]
MAKARMLHKTISVSEQVSNLTIEAQLLFTWLIPHADDEGRLKGNPKHIGVMVVPCHHWSPDHIQGLLEEIGGQGLIYFWEQDGQRYIEFPNWKTFQYIAKDRFHKSELPSYKECVDSPSTTRIQNVVKLTPQANVVESNKEEVKKSEANSFADKSLKSIRVILKEKTMSDLIETNITNRHEAAAFQAWKSLEPENKEALQTTYLNAVRKGVRAETIFQWISEIRQDRTIKNPGKIFNKKVEDYCKLKEDDKS